MIRVLAVPVVVGVLLSGFAAEAKAEKKQSTKPKTVAVLDQSYEVLRRKMERFAAAEGVSLDPSAIASTEAGDLASAPVAGFRDLKGIRSGQTAGVLYLRGDEQVPDGFYAVSFEMNVIRTPQGPILDPVGRTVLRRGDVTIERDTEFTLDPEPERGNRQEITIASGDDGPAQVPPRHQTILRFYIGGCIPNPFGEDICTDVYCVVVHSHPGA